MISRVAEQCYWLSRYLERAENTARVLDVNQTLLLDFEVPLEKQWRPLLIISGIHDYAGPLEAEAVQRHMTWETDNPSSIASSIWSARENARQSREVISADMWERLNYYYLWMQNGPGESLYNNNRSEFYSQVRRINQLFHGITDATMSHGEAWEFLQLGKYLERACQTARILDVKYHILLPSTEQVGAPIDSAQWVAVLTSCSAYEPFHKQARSPEQTLATAVADFLLFEPEFPRSVRRCLAECRKAAHNITGRPANFPYNAVEERMGELVEWFDRRDIEDMTREGLHESITSVVNRIHDVGDAIRTTWFDVAEQPASAEPCSVPSADSSAGGPPSLEPGRNGKMQ